MDYPDLHFVVDEAGSNTFTGRSKDDGPDRNYIPRTIAGNGAAFSKVKRGDNIVVSFKSGAIPLTLTTSFQGKDIYVLQGADAQHGIDEIGIYFNGTSPFPSSTINKPCWITIM